MNKNKIVEKAMKICELRNINTYPVPIVELCNYYGIKVFKEYLKNDVSGFIVVQKENYKDYGTNKVIVVNSLDTAARQRFTIAHELGHYILHKGNDELYAHRDVGANNATEREANVFASNLLMPENFVKSFLNNLKEDYWGFISDTQKILSVAEKFAVSNLAAKVRLEQLKLI